MLGSYIQLFSPVVKQLHRTVFKILRGARGVHLRIKAVLSWTRVVTGRRKCFDQKKFLLPTQTRASFEIFEI